MVDEQRQNNANCQHNCSRNDSSHPLRRDALVDGINRCPPQDTYAYGTSGHSRVVAVGIEIFRVRATYTCSVAHVSVGRRDAYRRTEVLPQQQNEVENENREVKNITTYLEPDSLLRRAL